jgi:hypothetical protein
MRKKVLDSLITAQGNLIYASTCIDSNTEPWMVLAQRAVGFPYSLKVGFTTALKSILLFSTSVLTFLSAVPGQLRREVQDKNPIGKSIPMNRPREFIEQSQVHPTYDPLVDKSREKRTVKETPRTPLRAWGKD